MPSETDYALLCAAGLVAGAVNAAAGGGSLLTFSWIVASGVPPLAANVSNTLAQVPGYVAIVVGYRKELGGQRARLVRLSGPALIGAVAGVLLLQASSPAGFVAVVPWLIVTACVLLAVQPRLRRRSGSRQGVVDGHEDPLAWAAAATAAGCAYAAYFGAAAGVLLLALLAISITDRLQRLNALNRGLICLANLAAAPLLVIFVGHVDWATVAVLAPSTLVGGRAGASIVRRLLDRALRAGIVALGLIAALWLIVR